MNFCKDCKHASLAWITRGLVEGCDRKGRKDPVNGGRVLIHAPTERESKNPLRCGPSGRYYQPRPTTPQ